MEENQIMDDYCLFDIIDKLKNSKMSSQDLEQCIKQLEIIEQRSIYWGVTDFRLQALELCRFDDKLCKLTYDESKFPEALKEMIENHDADWGISWVTVTEYLNKFCRKSKKR